MSLKSAFNTSDLSAQPGDKTRSLLGECSLLIRKTH